MLEVLRWILVALLLVATLWAIRLGQIVVAVICAAAFAFNLYLVLR